MLQRMLQDPVFFQHLVTCGVAEADGTLKNLEVGILQENPRFCSRTRGFGLVDLQNPTFVLKPHGVGDISPAQ